MTPKHILNILWFLVIIIPKADVNSSKSFWFFSLIPSMCLWLGHNQKCVQLKIEQHSTMFKLLTKLRLPQFKIAKMLTNWLVRHNRTTREMKYFLCTSKNRSISPRACRIAIRFDLIRFGLKRPQKYMCMFCIYFCVYAYTRLIQLIKDENGKREFSTSLPAFSD